MFARPADFRNWVSSLIPGVFQPWSGDTLYACAMYVPSAIAPCLIMAEKEYCHGSRRGKWFSYKPVPKTVKKN